MSKYEVGQSVIITGDQTSHRLPVGSTQVIDHIDNDFGLSSVVIIGVDHLGNSAPRWLCEEDVKPLDTMTA